jgi:hypothetical protein
MLHMDFMDELLLSSVMSIMLGLTLTAPSFGMGSSTWTLQIVFKYCRLIDHF